jgi:hypothetical protein
MVPGQTAHQQAAGRHDGGDDLLAAARNLGDQLAGYPVSYAINTMSS